MVPRKWENAFTIDRTSWGFNRNATIDKYYTVKELVHIIIETVAYNGNALMNIGPGADGTISPIFLDRLVGIGKDILPVVSSFRDYSPFSLPRRQLDAGERRCNLRNKALGRLSE